MRTLTIELPEELSLKIQQRQAVVSKGCVTAACSTPPLLVRSQPLPASLLIPRQSQKSPIGSVGCSVHHTEPCRTIDDGRCRGMH